MIRLALSLVLPLLSGCYFVQLADGQLALLNEQRPLAEAYADEADPERKRLMALVPDIRAYASQVVQMRPGRSYAGYFETEAEGITNVLVAAEKTRFEPYTWWFPIAGEVPYKSYFVEDDARAEEAELAAAGYDTWVGHATAYSTLGILRDPVTTVMMQRGVPGFVEVMFHEMAHARLYVPGQTDWNEQLASFVGQQAARDYIASRFTGDAVVLEEMELLFERRARLEERVAETIAELEVLYDRGGAPAVILRARRPILDALQRDLQALYPEAEPEKLVMNNARLMQYRRYDRSSEEMEALWKQAGASWVAFWKLAEARAEEL